MNRGRTPVHAQKHAATRKLELVPSFFAIYKCVFLRVMRACDLWGSVQTEGSGCFGAAITKCLWQTPAWRTAAPSRARSSATWTMLSATGARPRWVSRARRHWAMAATAATSTSASGRAPPRERGAATFASRSREGSARAPRRSGCRGRQTRWGQGLGQPFP